MDIASFMAGVPVVSSTDIDQDCIQTLKANEIFKDSDIFEGDLHDIESLVFISCVENGRQINLSLLVEHLVSIFLKPAIGLETRQERNK